MLAVNRSHLLCLAVGFSAACALPAAPAQAGANSGASMLTTASNAALPVARNNLGMAAVLTPWQFGGLGDTKRVQCNITTTAGNAALAVSGCGSPFVASDIGKVLVVNNAGSSTTTPLVTTITAVADATHLTMAATAGQSLAGVAEPVTWGHDDSAALQSCITQAATSSASQGPSYCYVPPAPKGFWGSAATLELFPNGKNTDVRGAGRYSSQIVALAPLSSLVHRAAGFAYGGGLKDIGFDGNKLTTDVGYFVCPVERHDSNIGFYNASTDADLVYGDATGNAGGCNTSEVHDIELFNMGAIASSTMDLYPTGDLPPYNLVVGTTDQRFYNVICRDAATYGVYLEGGAAAAADTVLYGVHCFSPDATSETGIFVNTALQRIFDAHFDNGITTGINIAAGGNVAIFGGHAGSATTTGITVASSLNNIRIFGFDGSAIATAANRIALNTPGSGDCVQGNTGATDNCPILGGLAIDAADGAQQVLVTNTTSATNYLWLKGATTGVAPTVQAQGSDTNINLTLGTKGNGTVKFAAHTQASDTTVGAASSCGTSPSTSGTDSNFNVTAGSGTVTACTVAFGQTWSGAPKCTLTGIGTGSTVLSLSSAPTTTQVVIASSASIGSQTVHVHCEQ